MTHLETRCVIEYSVVKELSSHVSERRLCRDTGGCEPHFRFNYEGGCQGFEDLTRWGWNGKSCGIGCLRRTLKFENALHSNFTSFLR